MSELNKTSIEKQNVTKATRVDKSRRRFTKAGAATPILMTLASQPAFGGGMQCMSAMMSGNLSQHEHHGCDLGWSPGGWCGAGGTVGGLDTVSAWNAAGFSYGDFYADVNATKPAACTAGSVNGQLNNNECYLDNGSTLSEIPGLVGLNGYAGTTTLRDIVCNGQGTDARHCVTAYLNASLPGINYILTRQQVIDLCNGTIPVPGGISLKSFLDSTWQ